MSPVMLVLPRSAAAWNSPTLEATLVDELEALGPHHPALRRLLQDGLTQTSAVAEAPLGVQVLGRSEAGGRIQVRLGIFYAGVIAGCNCADDPTPVDSITEHCELLVKIDPVTGEAWVTARDD
jgi:hypothetical protein